MSQIIPILNYEEGYKVNPYIDSQGYPTVAGGIRIGPKGASLLNYTFSVPRNVGDLWRQNVVDTYLAKMHNTPAIAAALAKCNDARTDALLAMCYQMGINGLLKFVKVLSYAAAGDFANASAEMLKSAWAVQTPDRAKREAALMASGDYSAYQGLI